MMKWDLSFNIDHLWSIWSKQRSDHNGEETFNLLLRKLIYITIGSEPIYVGEHIMIRWVGFKPGIYGRGSTISKHHSWIVDIETRVVCLGVWRKRHFTQFSWSYDRDSLSKVSQQVDKILSVLDILLLDVLNMNNSFESRSTKIITLSADAMTLDFFEADVLGW